ncbi:MAG: metalloregulator ArsR/SmtB family transcription factor [Chitinophagaceae bacterium]
MLKIYKQDLTNDTKLGSIDFTQIKKAALILRAINHSLRYKILSLIEEMQKATVTEMYVKLQLEQSVASQHLAILRRSSIVKTSRDGKFIYYELNHDRINELNKCVHNLLQPKTVHEKTVGSE